MIKQFQPIGHMLDVRRQRGVRGTAYSAKIDARERVVGQRGRNMRRPKRLDVGTKGKSGKIDYAKGELAALHDLKKRTSIEGPSEPIIVAIEKSPIPAETPVWALPLEESVA